MKVEMGECNTGVPNFKLGMWIFLASEVMFFAALIGSYIVLRVASPQLFNPAEILGMGVLGLNTFILICSSVTMVLALQAIQRGEVDKLKKNLLWTILLGVAFLVIKGLDYAHLVHNGFTISSSLFGACYFTLTGFHGLHVLAGIIAMLIMLWSASKGKFSMAHYDGIEGTGLYWHFVDLVWIVLFAILCLI